MLGFGRRAPQVLNLVGWTIPDHAAHVPCRGNLGLYPPQLVPARLVSFEQRCLEQVRALWREADQFNW